MRSTTAGSFAALSLSHDNNASQPSFPCCPLLDDRKLTLCRRMGARSGSKAGGAWGETKAAGKQASRGGRRSREFGGGARCMMRVVVGVEM